MKNDTKYLISLLIIIPFSTIWSGFVVTKLWNWFIVPTFDTHMLTIAPAIGITMFVRYLTRQDEAPANSAGSYSERFVRAISVAVFYPAFTLLFAWIVSLFL